MGTEVCIMTSSVGACEGLTVGSLVFLSVGNSVGKRDGSKGAPVGNNGL